MRVARKPWNATTVIMFIGCFFLIGAGWVPAGSGGVAAYNATVLRDTGRLGHAIPDRATMVPRTVASAVLLVLLGAGLAVAAL